MVLLTVGGKYLRLRKTFERNFMDMITRAAGKWPHQQLYGSTQPPELLPKALQTGGKQPSTMLRSKGKGWGVSS